MVLIYGFKSLSYFDDADPDPLPYMFWAVTWEDVKAGYCHCCNRDI